MPSETSSSREDGLVVVRAAGEWLQDEQMAALDRAVSECRREGLRGVVIDGRALTTQPDALDRFHAAERIVENGAGLRFAAVWAEEHITKLAEDLATSRGAVFLVTDDWDEAVEFVRGGWRR